MKKRKLQISQVLCFFSMFLTLYAITISAWLSYNDKQPLSEITITVVGLLTTLVNLGYFTLSGARDLSKDKCKIKEDKQDD